MATGGIQGGGRGGGEETKVQYKYLLRRGTDPQYLGPGINWSYKLRLTQHFPARPRTHTLLSRGCIQGDTWALCWSWLLYNLTLSHSRLWSPAFHPNNDEYRRGFPYYSKMKQPIGKGRKREPGGKGWKLTLWFRMYISWRRGSHHGGEDQTTAARVTPERWGSHHGGEGHTTAARVTPRQRGSHHSGKGHNTAARVTPRWRGSHHDGECCTMELKTGWWHERIAPRRSTSCRCGFAPRGRVESVQTMVE